MELRKSEKIKAPVGYFFRGSNTNPAHMFGTFSTERKGEAQIVNLSRPVGPQFL